MNARQFFDLVVDMRQAQKEYFRTRSKEVLTLSKSFESKVDAEIKRVKELTSQPEPSLFKED